MVSLARTREFTAEVVEELKKVTWPDWPQLKNATFLILVFVVIVAFIIWVMDLTIGGIINRVILNLFGG